MRVFVTGGAGYIGSILVKKLIENGYNTTVLDLFLFGDKGLSDITDDKHLRIVKGDVRTYDPALMRGHDVVVDLAAISQPDPLYKIDEKLFHEINYLAPIRTASIASKYNVERYIFTSTCSVYGFRDGLIDESSKPMPLENYAKSKYMAECDILAMKKLNKIILRLATVYGYSPKMRFDLVANAMTLTLFKDKKIRVGRPGIQIRPVVHIKDVVDGIVRVIEAPLDLVNGEIFNVGSDEQNYRIIDLANEIFKALGKESVIEFYGEPDTRSYIVSFKKIQNILKFKCKYTITDGVKEVYSALEDGIIRDEPWTKVIDWWYTITAKEIIKPLGIKEG